MSSNKKYACLEYRQYEAKYLANNNGDYLEFAPRDWDEKVKRVYTVSFYHPINKNKELLARPEVENTLTALGKLHHWDSSRTIYQFIIIKDVVYINPYFKGIINNIFYGKDCFIPAIDPKINTETIELKIKMLGGTIVTNIDSVDILIMPKTSSKIFNRYYFGLIQDIVFKDIISIPTLNSVYSKIYSEYNY